ncbi:DUF624 domain-containing protein [uncultured Trichococcus sp.]|uniref:DUF624 domain-containing protein n=1 Tax=uncultured Trichococcus sp. TaxID=189665 RepID=UPI0029C69DA1|nr:DUF624 domain-containing protein [uncultured Trichococcus sp.]
MSESESTLSHALMRGMQLLSSLVYLNLLWFLGVVAGGVVLGIGPATLSLCAVLRELIWELIWNQREIAVGPFFLQEYQRLWKESNRFIFLFYGIYLFLWLDFRVIMRFSPSIVPAFVVLAVLVFLVTCYFIVFYQVFDGSLRTKLKNSLLLPWLFPAQSLGILALVGGFLLLIMRFPVVAVLFLMSVPFALFHYMLRKKYWQHFRGKNQ